MNGRLFGLLVEGEIEKRNQAYWSRRVNVLRCNHRAGVVQAREMQMHAADCLRNVWDRLAEFAAESEG